MIAYIGDSRRSTSPNGIFSADDICSTSTMPFENFPVEYFEHLLDTIKTAQVVWPLVKKILPTTCLLWASRRGNHTLPFMPEWRQRKVEALGHAVLLSGN